LTGFNSLFNRRFKVGRKPHNIDNYRPELVVYRKIFFDKLVAIRRKVVG